MMPLFAIATTFVVIVVGIMVELLIHEVRGSRRVARENARLIAQWRVDCAAAKAHGQPPTFPPNRLVWG